MCIRDRATAAARVPRTARWARRFISSCRVSCEPYCTELLIDLIAGFTVSYGVSSSDLPGGSMAAWTPAVVVSVALQVGLGVLREFSPPVRPERIGKIVGILIGAIALICTAFGLALYPAALLTSPVWIATGFVLLALLSPLAGLVESRVRKNGQAVYSTGIVPGTPNRLPGHLITNVLGALAVAGLVWVAHLTNG